jgi:hypothetical protein
VMLRDNFLCCVLCGMWDFLILLYYLIFF